VFIPRAIGERREATRWNPIADVVSLNLDLVLRAECDPQRQQQACDLQNDDAKDLLTSPARATTTLRYEHQAAACESRCTDFIDGPTVRPAGWKSMHQYFLSRAFAAISVRDGNHHIV
jgi:hypothetical protein